MSSHLEDSSLDTIYGLLAHQHRRYALTCLTEHEPVTLPELAEEIARRKNDDPVTELSEDDVLQIELSLYHVHLPRLAEASLLEYNPERNTVMLTGNTDEITRFYPLEAPESEEPPTDEESVSGGLYGDSS